MGPFVIFDLKYIVFINMKNLIYINYRYQNLSNLYSIFIGGGCQVDRLLLKRHIRIINELDYCIAKVKNEQNRY